MDSSKQIQTMRYTQTVKINYIMPSVDAIFYLSTDTKSPEKLTDQVDIRQIDITSAVRGIVFDHTLRSVEDRLLCTEKRSQ